MSGFGFSKKNNGGFGLSGFSLGNAEKTFDKGLGQASNVLHNTGEKIDDFIYGHSKKQKNENVLTKKADTNAGLGFGVPGLSLGKSGTTLGNGLGKASNTNNGLSLGLPGGSIGFGGGGQGSTLNKVGDDLGKAGNAIEKTGEKAFGYFFGKNKKNPEEQTGRTPASNLSIPSPFGGSGIPSLTDIGKKVDGGIEKIGNKVDKTGKKVIDYFSGKGKPRDSESPKGKTDGKGLDLSLAGNGGTGNISALSSIPSPNLSFGSASISSDIGHKVDKTGKKVIDTIFGKGKPNDSGITVAGTNLTLGSAMNGTATSAMPNAILGGIDTGDKSFSNATLDLPLPNISFGGGSTPSLTDIGKKEDLEKIGHKIEKTGEKVIDTIFGKGKSNDSGITVAGTDLTIGGKTNGTATSAMPNVILGGIDTGNKSFSTATSSLPSPDITFGGDSTLGLTDIGKKMDKGLGLKAEKTGAKVDLNGNLSTAPSPSVSIPTPFGGVTLPTNYGEKITDDIMGTEKSALPNLIGNILTTSMSPEIYVSVSKATSSVVNELPESVNNAGNVSTLPFSTSAALPSSPLGTTLPSIPTLGKNLTGSGGDTTSSSGDITVSNATPFVVEKPPEGSEKVGIKVEDENMNTTLDTNWDGNEGTFSPTIRDDTFEETEKDPKNNFETNTGSPSNSEESSNALFGVSEIPQSPNKTSDETLKKIEDILQGSGKNNQPSNEKKSEAKEKKSGQHKPTGFTYTDEVSNEDSTSSNANTYFGVSVIEEVSTSTTVPPGPVILPPYIVVPNRNSTIGEQNTPKLPPTVFDKPTGDRAPFIPILPPNMESSTGNLMAPAHPNLIPHTTASPTSGNLSPVEYGAIGVGSVLICALLAFIYQKYKQYATSSSGGSYSPISKHRGALGRKRSSRSNDSEGGQSLEMNEVEKPSTTQAESRIHPEVVVVEIASVKADEVVETPMTKIVVNGLQKSSACENKEPIKTDSIEVISETKPIEKPPRKTKTPPNSPEKFTSDKTSASTFNQESLKTVSQALGGILRDQVPNETDNEAVQKQNKESGGDEEEGVSLIGKLAEKTKDSPQNSEENNASKDLKTGENISGENSDNEPLYRSSEAEVDAGSEYYSADENSDAKKSPPQSPLQPRKFEEKHMKNLRAEDVYNTEIISEDGRRRSLEEDIAESIEREEEKNMPSDESTSHEDFNHESLKPKDDTAESIKPEEENKLPTIQTSTSNEIDNTDGSQNPKADELPVESTVNEANDVGNTDESLESSADKTVPLHREEIYNLQSEAPSKENLDMTDESLKPSAPLLLPEEEIQAEYLKSSRYDTKHVCVPGHHTDLTREVYIRNLRNASPHKIEDAEEIVDDIIRTSQLSSQTLKSIQQDLGTSMAEKPKVQWSETLQSTELDSASPEFGRKNTGCDLDSFTWTERPNDLEEALDLTDSTTEGGVKPEESPTGELEETGLQRSAMDNFQGRSDDSIENSAQNACTSQEPIGRSQSSDLSDEGFVAEHRFEFIPPKQPQIFEDDLIVFSNSDKESISTISNSPAEPNCPNEDHQRIINKEEEASTDGGILIDPKSLITGNVDNHAKWYVPSDEISDLDLMGGGTKSGEGLYIVLTEETPKIAPIENEATMDIPTNRTDSICSGSPKRPRKNSKNFSNISYAYIDVNDDPRNEGWPEHLPRNIHSISGVGLIRTPDNYDALKEEDLEPTPSTSQSTNDNPPCNITSTSTAKPIPKFIIPNMDGRLTKRRASRRRQIKSLDSGVHHYYGEYLNLVEFPENDITKSKKEEKKEGLEEIEEVLTIKPDGTLIEEKIVIQNSHPIGSISAN